VQGGPPKKKIAAKKKGHHLKSEGREREGGNDRTRGGGRGAIFLKTKSLAGLTEKGSGFLTCFMKNSTDRAAEQTGDRRESLLFFSRKGGKMAR